MPEDAESQISERESLDKALEPLVTETCQQCPLLEVAKRRTEKALGKNDWETTELPLDSVLRLDIEDSSLVMIRAQADKVRECPRCRQGFMEKFKMPELWWSRWCRRSNGYFGCEDTAGTKGNFDGHNTWFRFLVKQTFEKVPEGQKDYKWYKFNVFTRWIARTKQSIVIVFDPKPAITERLPSPLLDSPNCSNSGDPYWVHALFVEEVVRLQDEAVWSIRNLVRKIEVQRMTATAPNPNYPLLHDISRHAVHVSETLDLAIKTVDCMVKQHEQFLADWYPFPDGRSEASQRVIRRSLSFHDHMLGSLRSRSTSNRERVLDQIQLAFNVVAQYDSRIGVEVGRAAQTDSAAMKTIAFLSLTFFPATFTSAIFSMSFFNYNPDTDSWTVSRMFWVYWAVAIPITCITALLWSYWHRFFPPMPIGGQALAPRGRHPAKREFKSMATELKAKIEDGYVTETV